MKMPTFFLLLLLLGFPSLFGENNPKLGESTVRFVHLPVGDLMAVYPVLTGEDVVVSFKDEKESRLVVSLVEEKPLSQKALEEKILMLLKVNGLELRALDKKRVEVVRVLNEEETKKLNEKLGRKWSGLEYASRVRRVRKVDLKDEK